MSIRIGKQCNIRLCTVEVALDMSADIYFIYVLLQKKREKNRLDQQGAPRMRGPGLFAPQLHH